MEEGHEGCSFSGLDDDSGGSNVDRDGELSVMSGCFFLDHAGEVLLSRNQDGLSWKFLDSSDCVRFVDHGICSCFLMLYYIPRLCSLTFLSFWIFFPLTFNHMCMDYPL